MLFNKVATGFVLFAATVVRGAAIDPSKPTTESLDPAVFNATEFGEDYLDLMDATMEGEDEVTTQRKHIGKNLCRHVYRLLYEKWIVQVPGSWWKRKYATAQRACDAWRLSLMANRVYGLSITECREITGQEPSGEPGWLHARFTTIIGPMTGKVERSFNIFEVAAFKEKYPVVCKYRLKP
ncbi:hypothetical protein AB5N19_11828 [Seiridium cardinale]|uniref:Uncharacterized protein n=1 Tax=Seiridium cardinale TaxID=138064 RepID=A0ABR2XHC4_9PEZI